MRYVYLLILTLLFLPAVAQQGSVEKIDITGNWHEGSGYLSHIQTREPELKDGELKTFLQQLYLLPGDYSLQFEYDEEFDKSPRAAFQGHIKNFEGLKVNNKALPLNFAPIKKGIYKATCRFTVPSTQHITYLSLSLHNTRVIRTWLLGNNMKQNSNRYYAVSPGTTNEYLLVHEIPFLARKTNNLQYGVGFEGKPPMLKPDRGELSPWKNGMEFNIGGAKVSRLHFLGMIHKADIGSGAWYSNKWDNGYSHFIGDKAGNIIITYADNKTATIPLIFGFNLWFGRPWDMLWFHYPGGATDNSARLNFDADLFSGDPKPRKLIEDALYLTDGAREMGSRSSNTRFIFSVDVGNKAIKSIRVTGVKDMYAYPLISAITVEAAQASSKLVTLPGINQDNAAIKPATVNDIVKGAYKPAVEKLKHAIYTYTTDLPKLREPEIPQGYFGPYYNFKGTQEAVYAATYLYRNGPECGAKIADNGTSCTSSLARSQTVRYTLATGIWRGYQPLFGDIQNWFKLYQTRQPGELPGVGQAWSRGIGELMREAMGVGYGKFINTYTNWLDSCLFADSNPPHWGRVPGMDKQLSSYKVRKVGNITEKGNRENDGHGICMMGRYMAYHWLGHPMEWNARHWKATKAAVDWIQWQLDTDTIFPGKRIDALYTESESGNYEFYSSYNCLHGIKLSIIMAKELGKTAEVEAWTKLYKRLQKGILDNELTQTRFGLIWFTNSRHWKDDAQKMTHIQLATDGITYTPLQDYANGDAMDKKFLEIDRNTYRYLLQTKNYNYLRMFGYGQGMMAQSALLMDEMDDAEHFINFMVDHGYLSHMEHWAAPEGIMLHKSGQYWMPLCGYLGQDSHLADSQKALRIMLGIDDNKPDQLRLVPRFPSSWNEMAIRDFPVLTGKVRQKIHYNYQRTKSGQTFTYGLKKTANNISLRLGPIPAGKEVATVLANGKKQPFTRLSSGDSRWIWVNSLSGIKGEVKLVYSVR